VYGKIYLILLLHSILKIATHLLFISAKDNQFIFLIPNIFSKRSNKFIVE